MSVEFDATGAAVSSGSSITVPLSVTTLGSGRLILAGASLRQSGGTPSVSGITFQGDAFTQLHAEGSAAYSAELWYLFAPATGSGNVVASLTNASGALSVASFTGVDVASAAAAFGTLGTASDSASPISNNVSSLTGEMVIDFLLARYFSSGGPIVLTPDAGQTEFSEADEGSGSTWASASGSYKKGAASVTMGWSWNPTGASVWQFRMTLHAATPLKNRAIDYISNTFQSRAAGRTVILDALGRDVPPEQIQQDKWLRVDGPAFVSSYRYASNIDDPSVYYSESVSLGDSLSIKTDRQSLLESLLGRLGGRSI